MIWGRKWWGETGGDKRKWERERNDGERTRKGERQRVKLTRKRGEERGREGGNRNQRERSTAGRRQTDTHFKHTHSQQHTEMHKNFKHLNVGVCSGGSVRIMTFLTWLEGIYNLTHAHTNTQKPSQSFKFWSIISHACHRSGRTRTFAWHHRHTHAHTLAVPRLEVTCSIINVFLNDSAGVDPCPVWLSSYQLLKL